MKERGIHEYVRQCVSIYLHDLVTEAGCEQADAKRTQRHRQSKEFNSLYVETDDSFMLEIPRGFYSAKIFKQSTNGSKLG
jgi:hypothetical protein